MLNIVFYRFKTSLRLQQTVSNPCTRSLVLRAAKLWRSQSGLYKSTKQTLVISFHLWLSPEEVGPPRHLHSQPIPSGWLLAWTTACALYPLLSQAEFTVPGMTEDMWGCGTLFFWRLGWLSSLTPACRQACDLPLRSLSQLSHLGSIGSLFHRLEWDSHTCWQGLRRTGTTY